MNVYKFGCIVAVVISFSVNKSITWAVVHGLLSWFYVLYAALNVTYN